MIELLDATVLEHHVNERIHVVLENGRVIAWRCLDDMPICAVEGDG